MGADIGYLQNKIRKLNEELEIIDSKVNKAKSVMEEMNKIKSETEKILSLEREPLEKLLTEINKGLKLNNKLVEEMDTQNETQTENILKKLQEFVLKQIYEMEKNIILKSNKHFTDFQTEFKNLRKADNEKVFRCLNELAVEAGKEEDYFHSLRLINLNRKGKIKKMEGKIIELK